MGDHLGRSSAVGIKKIQKYILKVINSHRKRKPEEEEDS